MKKVLYLFVLICLAGFAQAQDHPAIKNWLINTTGITGRHYVAGNSTPISDTAKANVQLVRYSDNYVYINCSGIPSYIVGPYTDGNPSLATNNNWLFKIPLNPVKNSGTLTSTPMGQIGVFINGVPMYDYKDGASYSSAKSADDMMAGDGVWNRNAILAENDGFDCAKGHPSPIFDGPPGPGSTLKGGTYHHHQNPSAFNLDLRQVSDICDLYLADGLYKPDSTVHSPLIGFAFDGFPIYGPYSYENTDGTGKIVRMESSYAFRKITERTTYSDGSIVKAGPAVSETYPIGWYREDYEFIEGHGHLDAHNGRFCVTPEYPQGTYAYFTTVDKNWNSTYPYVVGPEYYGMVESSNLASGPGGNTVKINEVVKKYNVPTGMDKTENSDWKATVFPNPSSDIIAIQVNGLLKNNLDLKLYDMNGRLVRTTTMNQGSTIWHLDVKTIYAGEYLLQITDGTTTNTQKVLVVKD